MYEKLGKGQRLDGISVAGGRDREGAKGAKKAAKEM
jgi:hypothetical protein